MSERTERLSRHKTEAIFLQCNLTLTPVRMRTLANKKSLPMRPGTTRAVSRAVVSQPQARESPKSVSQNQEKSFSVADLYF